MRAEKVQLVNDIGDMIAKADFIFFITYKGLKVGEFSDFRNNLVRQNAECHVLRNRLIKKAVELRGIKGLAEFDLRGDTAVITGKGDPSEIAKLLTAFSKNFEAVSPKGGFWEGSLLNGKDVKDIASLPSKEILQAQLLGLLETPLRNLVGVFYVKLSELVNVLNAYTYNKGKSE